MNNIIQLIKKAGLFLFGIVLIVWGYKANATNNEKAKADEKLKMEAQTQEEANPMPEVSDKPDTTKTESPKQEPVKAKETPAKAEAKKEVKKEPAKETAKEPAKKEEAKVETPKTKVEQATPEEASGTE